MTMRTKPSKLLLTLLLDGRGVRARPGPGLGRRRAPDHRPGRLRHLTPAVREKVDQILPTTPTRSPRPDIASRATWADKFRDSDRHTSQRRYRLTREWHFVDIELDGPDLTAACFGHPAATVPASEGPAKACVVDRIDGVHRRAARPVPSPERTIAFKFVLHLVGDVHQPLHAADHHDAGGNGVLVLFGRQTVGEQLHAYWDTTVVKRLGKDPERGRGLARATLRVSMRRLDAGNARRTGPWNPSPWRATSSTSSASRPRTSTISPPTG